MSLNPGDIAAVVIIGGVVLVAVRIVAPKWAAAADHHKALTKARKQKVRAWLDELTKEQLIVLYDHLCQPGMTTAGLNAVLGESKFGDLIMSEIGATLRADPSLVKVAYNAKI